ncbi:MAG: hypothetical protein H6Q65_3 [Firmicutes bacterium]|nr:hypothetical protein [Bacillota bacterium]
MSRIEKLIREQMDFYRDFSCMERLLYFIPLIIFGMLFPIVYTKLKISQTNGSPLDFCIQYVATTLAVLGFPESVYDMDTILHYMEITLNRPLNDCFGLGWFYPPTTLLLFVPFTLFPYQISLYIWMVTTSIAYTYILYRIAPIKKMPFVIIGFPGLLMNVFFGQNGAFTTVLLALSYYFINRRPYVSGIFAGLLCYKPQFAVLWFLVLLLTKKYKTISTASIVVGTQITLSWLLFGLKTWVVYLNSIEVCVDIVLKSGWHHFNAIHPSLYAFTRLLYFEINTAFFVQGIGASIIVISIIYICVRIERTNTPMITVLVGTGTFLFTPYVNQYDLAIIALPFVLYTYEGITLGWLKGEKVALALLWIMPLLNWPLVMYTRIQIAPLVILAVFILAMRRIIYIDNIDKANVISNDVH